jgi:hypothetical protein
VIKKIIYFLIGILSFAGNANAQYGFQKVYDQHDIDTLSILTDIYLFNDSIYFSGGGRTGNAYGLRFARVDESGDLESLMRYDIPNHAQRAFFSRVDTDTNFRGNLVNLYKSYDLDFSRSGYRLVEYSFNGNIVFDSLYNTWSNDSISIFDGTYLLHDKEDSAYILLMKYADYKANGTPNNTSGVLVNKIKYTGEVIWSNTILNPSLNNVIQTGGNNIEKRSNGGYDLHYREVRNGSENLGTFWAKQHFAVLDDTGNVVSDKVFQDGDYCYTFSEAFFDGDTIYLQYYDSKLYNGGQNNATYKVKPVLAKIGPNMELIWKNELQSFWDNYVDTPGSIKRIRKVNDTAFVGARRHINLISDTTLPLTYTLKTRLYNFTRLGKYNWIRDYYYYPIDSIKDASYEINDIEIMSDGGYILGGESWNRDSTSQGKPGQFAYLLRTNCLGFLSPPQAQFEYESEKNEVFFINNSMNAGSCTWYFGEGDSLHTGENVDSITHIYEYGGQYEVTFIAHGCNGAGDTVKLNINVEQGAYGNIGDNYFSLYPNPVQQGNVITIETGNVENGELHFYDAQGRWAKTVQLPDAKSIYFIEHDFSAATYSLVLSSKGEVLQRMKLVVQ